MRLFPLLGLFLLAAARQARAETPEPDEPPIELGPPPPPPPGARVTEHDEPSVPAPPPPDDAGVAPTPPAPPAARRAERRPLPPAPADNPSAPARHDAGGWYGWKILIADGGALVLATTSQPLGTILGGGAFVLTAPSIHLGHRRELAALGSLALRIAAPLTLNALIEKNSCDGDFCIQPGALAGAALASLVDVVVLANDGGKPAAKKAELVTPAVAAGPKGTALFLTGSF